LDVGIFERNPVIGKDVNCTGIVSGECLKKFDLPEEAILRPINSIRAIAPSGGYLRYQANSPLAYVVSRSLFDSEINKMAVKEGATIYLNAGVKEIKVSDQAFIVTLNTGGEKMEFNARVGVIATGFELHALQGLGKRHANCFFGIQTDVKMENPAMLKSTSERRLRPGHLAGSSRRMVNPLRSGSLRRKIRRNF
jgi:flavin-dependent dehydrogenase